ncbi:hypothetical protein [Nocardioides sp. KR10-350]|uniref:hypothetical protein n=1 Tax=Nocardioides cheoyonin TaxID=3156615 RepID=UPI0032B4AEE0
MSTTPIDPSLPGVRITPRSLLCGPESPEERLAWRRIVRATKRAHKHGTRIHTATARLIAAAVHSGPDSPLQRFATTGHVGDGAEAELQALPHGSIPEPWRRALADYLRTASAAEEAGDGRA